MTNPDNVGGQWPAFPPLPKHYTTLKVNGAALFDAFQVHQYAMAYGELCRAQLPNHGGIGRKSVDELCRAAPAGGDEEQLRVQLAGCGVIAMCNTRESLAKQMPERGSYGHSESLEDVRRAVLREMSERSRAESAEHALMLALGGASRGEVAGYLYDGPYRNGPMVKKIEGMDAPAGSGEVLSVYSLNRVIDRVEGEAQWNDWSQGRILTELRDYIRAQATVIPDPKSMGDNEADNIESYATALERMSLCNSRTADGANLSQAARLIHEYAALLRKLQQVADTSAPRECPYRFRCDCLGACKYGLAGGGAASQGQEGGK